MDNDKPVLVDNERADTDNAGDGFYADPEWDIDDFIDGNFGEDDEYENEYGRYHYCIDDSDDEGGEA